MPTVGWIKLVNILVNIRNRTQTISSFTILPAINISCTQCNRIIRACTLVYQQYCRLNLEFLHWQAPICILDRGIGICWYCLHTDHKRCVSTNRLIIGTRVYVWDIMILLFIFYSPTSYINYASLATFRLTTPRILITSIYSLAIWLLLHLTCQ